MNENSAWGSSGIWIFGLLILLALIGGNGGGLFGGGERTATVGDVQRSQDFAALERQMNEGVAATRQGVYDVTGAVKDGNYNILGELRDLQTVVSSGLAQMQSCCCEILRAIDGVNYNVAINTASIKENSTAQAQRILDAIAADKAERQAQRINQLEMQQLLCGIPRTSPYGYSVVPQFANIGCNSCGGYAYNI